MTLQERYARIKNYVSDDSINFITRNLASISVCSDEDFNQIDALLKQYGIVTLSSITGNPNLKIFAMDPKELEDILRRCSEIGEVSFVMFRSDLVTDKDKMYQAIENIRDAKENGEVYKDENGYVEEVIMKHLGGE